jgi:hypothetical protein
LNYFLTLKSYLQNRHFLVKIENEYTELSPLNVGVPLGPLLYLLFTADDTAVIATDNDPDIASSKIQANLLAIRSWLAKWRMEANGSKSTYITFTMRRGTCAQVHIGDVQLPQTEEVKNLGLHLDRRLTWHKHIFTKGKQLGIALPKMFWLRGRK